MKTLSVLLLSTIVLTSCASTKTQTTAASRPSDFSEFKRLKKVDLSQMHMTLSNFQKAYKVDDLAFVSTVNRCGGPNDTLGADIYYSKEMNAEVAVSLKGELQQVTVDQEFKSASDVAKEKPCHSRQ